MLRDIFKKAAKTIREKISGQQDIQTLLDRQNVKMTKTKEVIADDLQGLITWSYRFTFDNEAKKRRFLQSIEAFPAQEWDQYVRWLDDISNLDGQFCVEAYCKVPPSEAGRFRHKFQEFVTRELVVKG